MKILYQFYLAVWMIAPPVLQGQTFTVALASNRYSNYWNSPTGPNPYNVDAGYNYIISGYLYPGDYFETRCPDKKDCGILLETVLDASGNPVAYTVSPEDTAIVIGDWDCRSYIVQGFDLGAVGGESSIGDISTQTFHFYPHPLSPCPQGCLIVTEGYLDRIDNNRRSIAGGTQSFLGIKGDLSWVYLPLENSNIPGYGRNSTGRPNITYSFEYKTPPIDQKDTFTIDVSLKKQTLHMSQGAESYNPVDPSNPVGDLGATFSIEGVIYKGGTFEKYGYNSGITSTGTAEWAADSIGTWIARGAWTSREYGFDDGFFAANKQTLIFNHPEFGRVQLMTDSEGDASLNETIHQAVIGATGSLLGHAGESTQKTVGKNTSGGWNFSYAFDIGTSTTEVEEPRMSEIALGIKILPNPAHDHLSMLLDNLPTPGNYELNIYNSIGQLLMQRKLEVPANQFQYNFNITTLPAGLHKLIIKHNGRILGATGFIKY